MVLNSLAQKILLIRIMRCNLNATDIVFPYKVAQYSRLWKRMRDYMNIPGNERFTPHCTRHTFASKLAQKDVSIYKVSRLLGHTSVTTTEMYSHLFTSDLADTVEKLIDDEHRKRDSEKDDLDDDDNDLTAKD